MLPHQFGSSQARIQENAQSFRMAHFGDQGYPPPGPGWMTHSNRPFCPNFPPNNRPMRPNFRFDMPSNVNSNSKYFPPQHHNQMFNHQHRSQGPECYNNLNSYAKVAVASVGPQNQIHMMNNSVQNRPRPLFPVTQPLDLSSPGPTFREPNMIQNVPTNNNRPRGEKTQSQRISFNDQTKYCKPMDSRFGSITFGSFEDVSLETRTGVGPEMPGDFKLKEDRRIKKNNVSHNGNLACPAKNEGDHVKISVANTHFDNMRQSYHGHGDVISNENIYNKTKGYDGSQYTEIESNLNLLVISNSDTEEEDSNDDHRQRIYKDETKAELRNVVIDIDPLVNQVDSVTDFTHTEDGDYDPFAIQNDNSDDNDSEKENEEEVDSQNELDNSEEPGEEQRKFTKSYWRKQRRLRLKERLLAQKALMENDPDYIPEQKESSKDSKNIKTKVIDYDLYLPAHVLMHVKRDLVSVLMEYGQTREVKVTFEDMERSGPHHASRFHTAAVVDDEIFPIGSGSSKKMAKKAAAAHALKIMYERGRNHLDAVNETANLKICNMSQEEIGTHAHKILLVSRHVLETVEETQFINYSKDKICATFVLEHNNKMRVVGLGTGNRCILYQHMTKDGLRVLHSHAEIMAKRAFMRFLYTQLLGYQSNKTHPLFTRSETGKLKLRDKFQVHLYISRPPCGDAAAFPTISNFPNKMRAIRKQGQLRTIIDDGEGAIPTDFDVPAGPNGKERLRIMTCSDKICRWNVLGVQGALLSHYIDPIYLNSLVIGSHTGDQQGHVPRAVSGRLKCGRLHEVIQRPYRINSPEIHYPIDELSDQYNITKSKQYCITWAYGDIDAEILDAITGVANMEPMDDPVPSRVAKTTLFDLFHQVCHKFGRKDLATLNYVKAKKSAATFQRMKSFVGQHLAAMGFGQWYSLQQTYGTDSFPCPEQC